MRAPKPPPPGYPVRFRTLGDHVRKRRMDLTLTQKALGAHLGVDQDTVRNWEAGRTAPAGRFLPTIHDFLGYCPLEPARTLGDRLRQARETAGLSRRELGRRTGLDEGTIARLERGVARRPTPRTVRVIAGFLGRDSPNRT